jgi:3-hydroxyisobutyrate dehydrogenase/2-hydroxy-3-oxopropionate reductase
VAAVGVAGTGRMGSAIARALVAAGHDPIVWNRTPDGAATLVADLAGRARVATTPAEVAAASDVTITMVADDTAVAAVFSGPDGLVAGAHPGGVLVDMSTVLPATIRSLEGVVRATGSGLLDAPVSGSVGLAQSGQLTLMVGGRAEDLERARPVLESMSKAIFHLGPLGAGAVMKLAVNTVIFGLNQAVAEALALAEASGLDLATAYDVLATGAAGAPYVGYKREQFLIGDAAPVAFALSLAEKDLRLIAETAAAVGQPMPQALLDLELVRAAAAGGRGGRDLATVTDALRSRRAEHPGFSGGATGEEMPSGRRHHAGSRGNEQ